MILNAVERGQACAEGRGEGRGPPVVLLHGLFGRATNFGTVQRHLAQNFRVLALDLRNHGDSPHAAGMSYPEMAGDVLATLRARDALPCALVGHSMGGKVAMALALASAESVSRLVVADIAPVRYPPHFQDFLAAMLALPLTPELTRAAADAMLAPAVPDPRIRAFLLQNLAVGPAPSWRIGLHEIAAALPVIEGWDVAGPPYPRPTVFLAGARSDYILPAHRPEIRRLFPAARFVTLKDAGHWLHADNPAGFVAVIEAALS